MRRIVTRTGAATALCTLALAVPAGDAHAAAPAGEPPPDEKAGIEGIKATTVEVDKLFQEAAAATEQFEAARQAIDRQRKKVKRLQTAVAVQQRKLQKMQTALGQMAARQYQSGGLAPTAQLMLSDSPEELLDRVYLMDKGNQAAGNLYGLTERAEQRLEGEKSRSAQALVVLKQELDRQGAVKKSIEGKLERAQAKLEKLQTAEEAKARSAACSAPGRTRVSTRSLDGKAIGSRKWQVPVHKYKISSRFAQSGENWSARHTGLDFAVAEGQPVASAGYGTVHELGCDGAFGNSVTIKHDDGYYTFYAHLSEISVKPGQRVFPGGPIGLAGTTGNSTGPHLHFEVRVTPHFGSGINPEPWLKRKGVKP